MKQILPESAGKVVEHSDLVSLLHQLLNYMTADIPGAADYQNLHYDLL
jgi:hypothetical protein